MAKVGFVFSTKDRPEFSQRSIRSVDDAEFDLFWFDGSDSPEGRALPSQTKFTKCNLVEVRLDVKGTRVGKPAGWHPADDVITLGLRHLLVSGYDYCGLIENDIELEPGWFNKLMDTIDMATDDGFKVGAASVRTFSGRVLEYQPNYALLWNMGAGMVLFSKLGALATLMDYGPTPAIEYHDYYKELIDASVISPYSYNHVLGCDWKYAMSMYKAGLVSVSTIPTMGRNFDGDYGDYAMSSPKQTFSTILEQFID
jgi:hypothetical protein